MFISTILTIDVFLGSGGQFLDVHQDRAVAGEADHGALRLGQRGADGGRQAEAHRAEPAGGQPLARAAERVGLRDPHLVLADVGGDDRVVVEAGGDGCGSGRSASAGRRRPGMWQRKLRP